MQSHGGSFADGLRHSADAGVTGKALGGIRDLLDLLDDIIGHDIEEGVAATLEAVLAKTGYLAELEAERSVESEGRIENLRELIGVAGDFDAQIEAGDETVVLAGSDDVPDEFRAMVQEYYRSLGKTPR